MSIVVDGVELIPSTTNEAVLVPGLVEVLEAFTVRGARAAQVALDELGLELCLFRTRGTELELRVVQLGAREASTRPPVLIEAGELRAGLLACLKGVAPTGADATKLARAAAAIIPPLSTDTPMVHELGFREGGFGFRLVDDL
ncbi:MAG: hypothetical protein JNG84_09585, partial [Archangium sp.]|nr:hypothetical protein [Archangium sp.]